MPRYVVLRHDPAPGASSELHWDLMLEAGEVLKTWSLEEEPRSGAGVAAEMLADHRKAYLDYEGPVSHDRGHVTRWDWGTYQQLRASERELVVTLQGEKLRGATRLVRRGDEPQRWTVEFPPG
jgi:hypothetical protein